ncbi:cytochrome P450 [Hypoxylon fuscum]|nr:cytochrome P450 [Hypoxylon fuscum]
MWEFIQQQYSMLREQYGAMSDAMAPVRHSKSELVFFLRKIVHGLLFSLLDPSSKSRYAVSAVLVFIIVFVVDQIRARMLSLRRLGLPVVSPSKGVHQFDYKAILAEGARRYPNSPYLITYSGFEYVVFPASSWDEVKRIPPTKASALAYFTHVFFGGWKLLGSDMSAVHKSIGVDLTRAIPIRVHAHQESARAACDSVLGRYSEWKSYPMYFTLQAIIAATNATGLVGPVLGNDRRWVRAVQIFPMVIVFAIYTSSLPPRLFRPLVTLFVFLPAWATYWYMRNILRPVVQQDMHEYELAAGNDEKRELMRAKPDSKFPMTAWMLSRYTPEERTAQQVAHDFIVASFESTPSTSSAFYFIMAELVARPEVVQELRNELESFMVDGHLPQTQLDELQKLDSFMRECSRCNPHGYMALFRRLREPVKLSNCPELPIGAVICVDVHDVPWSEQLWEKPKEFDPWRFLKLRQLPGREQRHQYTSLGSESPSWGDGSQACPGRVFASSTLKVTLAHLIMNFDFKLPDDGSKPERNSMPNGSARPDMWVRIMFRERKKRQ